MSNAPLGFLARHEFLLRRLHSLSGLIPVGAYMVVHLVVNASAKNGPETFQTAVNQIHSLGDALWIVEWGFIFLPLLFHAIFGVVIIRGGLPNNNSYPYGANVRYTLQRASGMLAMLFIFYHVFQLHGWFHTEWWLANVAEPWGGAKFRPYNATSTVAEALQTSVFVYLFYLVGVAACVFHLANGIWTMGITWGVWVSPAAQKRAGVACLLFGLGLGAVSLTAWSEFTFMSEEKIERAVLVEDRIFESLVESGILDAEKAEHKRSSHSPDAETQANAAAASTPPADTEPADATPVGADGE